MFDSDKEADQAAAMAAVEPALPLIHQILDESVAFYFDDAHYSAEARAAHTERAMANCIYSHAEMRLLAAEDPGNGIHVLNVRGLRALNHRDLALARFKKVKPDGRHSNYQTQQQQDYDDQLPLPGIPPAAYRLTAGYQLDAAGSALERIMIARPIGRSIFWTCQVTVINKTAQWTDITPERFTGTDGLDFDVQRARGKRRGQ